MNAHVRGKHPSEWCYRRHGCRCPGCKAINAERSTQYRRSAQYRLKRGIRPVPRVPRGVPHTLVRLYREIGLDAHKISRW